MADGNSVNNGKDVSWGDFMSEIFVERIWKFLCQPITVFYLVFIVGVVGASGVWLPLVLADLGDKCFKYDETLSLGLATYCIAILSATMADQTLLKEENNRTIRFFSLSIVLISVIFAYVVISKKDVTLGFFTAFLSYLVWIITYAKDPAKQDQNPSSPNPTGDDPKTTPLSGSTESFKVQ